MKKNITESINLKTALVLGLFLVALLYFYKDSLLKIVSPSNNSKSPVVQEVSKEAPDFGYNEVATITYDGATLSPQNVSFTLKPEEVKPGDALSGQWIKIINKSESPIRVYSEPPLGNGSNEELNAGLIASGEFKIAKITKKGTWHYTAGVTTGAIIVK